MTTFRQSAMATTSLLSTGSAWAHKDGLAHSAEWLDGIAHLFTSPQHLLLLGAICTWIFASIIWHKPSSYVQRVIGHSVTTLSITLYFLAHSISAPTYLLVACSIGLFMFAFGAGIKAKA